ncbi:MAG TPA: hypothetical protein DCY20_06880 [Firmicutes bacterium]|nr:hypothetical protein [Bacillota bacterium]
MLKEKEFGRTIKLNVCEAIYVIRNFNRRCTSKILLQQHIRHSNEIPYVNFTFYINQMKFYEQLILLTTDSGELELIIAPYYQEVVLCKISYLTHHQYGGWWFEIGNLRFIFQCTYEFIMEMIEDEQKSQSKYDEKNKYDNGLFHAICLGERIEYYEF